MAQGVKRWGDRKGGEGVNYENLGQAKVAGRELRAVQLAQNAVKKLTLSGELSLDAIQNRWTEIATTENGFREADGQLNETDEFRCLVINGIEKILRQNISIQDRNDGRPRSWLEQRMTNRMVNEINCSIQRQIVGIENEEPWRYRKEGVTRRVMGGLSRWKGLRPETEEAQREWRELSQAAEVHGVHQNELMTLMEVAWQELMKGTESIFKRIHGETVNPPTDRTAVLDLPILGKMIRSLSASLIGGNDLNEVFANPHIQECLDEGASLTVAYEVESTYDEETANKNKEKFIECAQTLGAKEEKREKTQMKFMSLKLSSLGLYTQDPKTWDKKNPPKPNKEGVKEKMREILDVAVQNGVYVNIDMEYFVHKDVTFEIFKELNEEENGKYADHLGMVFQAYLKDSPQDAVEMAKWAQDFKQRTGKRVNLRLVKGANLKAEADHTQLGVHGHFRGQTTTWHGKARAALTLEGDDQWKPNENTPLVKDVETAQVQYIEIMKLFEENTECLNVRYGTMNPDTMAHIIQTWLNNGENITERQIQMLFGMYNSLQKVVRKLTSMRVYVPYGILGMILDYMGRRFVEYQKVQEKGGMPKSQWEYDEGPSVNVLAKVA